MFLIRPMCLTSLARAGMGNLQGIAGHIASMIFSAGRNYVSCVNSKKKFRKISGEQKRSSRPQKLNFSPKIK